MSAHSVEMLEGFLQHVQRMNEGLQWTVAAFLGNPGAKTISKPDMEKMIAQIYIVQEQLGVLETIVTEIQNDQVALWQEAGEPCSHEEWGDDRLSG